LPWSVIYMGNKTPKYLIRAVSKKYAEQLLRPLGVPDIETLQVRLKERASRAGRTWGPDYYEGRFDPLYGFNIQSIGSR
ncbi:MAG TPA: hypothetical protein VF707_02375, partial [Ardenticatenaceae bacterium]